MRLHFAQDRRSRPALAIAFFRDNSAQLEQRLERIGSAAGLPRCRSPRVVRVLCSGAILAVAATLGMIQVAGSQAAGPGVPPRPTAGVAKVAAVEPAPDSLAIEVVAGDTGLPLANARIRRSPYRLEDVILTDQNGHARLVPARDPSTRDLWLQIWTDGYIQQTFAFAPDNCPVGRKVPRTLKVSLNPSEETFGGIVVDDRGLAVAGARVWIYAVLGELKADNEAASWLDTVTDSRGQWRCRGFRGTEYARLMVTHPTLVDDTPPGTYSYRAKASGFSPGDRPIELLRTFHETVALSRGVKVSGAVHDEAGRPIAGAEITLFDASLPNIKNQVVARTRSDDHGRFAFANVRRAAAVVQVVARDFAPGLEVIAASTDDRAVRFQLRRASVLHGRVVDDQGRPVPGARVAFGSFRGYVALGAAVATDDEGHFKWTQAPGDPIKAWVYVASDSYDQGRLLTPGEDKTLPISLRETFTFWGSVRDARTNTLIEKPVAEILSVDPATGQSRWELAYARGRLPGFYHGTVDWRGRREIVLRVRAAGYRPVVSRVHLPDERRAEWNVKLTEASGAQ